MGSVGKTSEDLRGGSRKVTSAMTAENQALFDGIRRVVADTVKEAITPLTERVEALTERVDVLAERVDALAERTERIEAEQRDQRTLLNAMSTQVSSVSLHVTRLDSLLETIDTRTNQMESDLFDIRDRLRQVEDRVRDGFHGLKQDISAAFSDIRTIRKTQNRQDKTITSLRDERAAIQQRLSALEGSQG
jgi:chromosome segregation ATPase